MRKYYYLAKALSFRSALTLLKKEKRSVREVLKMYSSRLRIYPWYHQKDEKRIEKGITFSLCDLILFAKLVHYLKLSVAFHT